MRCINLIHDRPYTPAIYDVILPPVKRWNYWQARRFLYFGGESCLLRRVDEARIVAAAERIDMIDHSHWSGE